MILADIATEIYTDLEQPSSPDQTAIQAWLTAHIGDLNVAIAMDFSSDSGDILPVPTNGEKSIYKNIYFIYYYGLLLKRALGASAYDWSEVTEGDSTVRRVSRNEIAKTYQVFIRDAEAQLQTQIARYRFDKSLPQSLEAVNDLRQFMRFNSVPCKSGVSGAGGGNCLNLLG